MAHIVNNIVGCSCNCTERSDKILNKLRQLQRGQETIMGAFEDLQAQIAANAETNAAAISGIQAIVVNVAADVAALKAIIDANTGGLTAEQVAGISALIGSAQENTSAALAATATTLTDLDNQTA